MNWEKEAPVIDSFILTFLLPNFVISDKEYRKSMRKCIECQGFFLILDSKRGHVDYTLYNGFSYLYLNLFKVARRGGQGRAVDPPLNPDVLEFLAVSSKNRGQETIEDISDNQRYFQQHWIKNADISENQQKMNKKSRTFPKIGVIFMKIEQKTRAFPRCSENLAIN